jgi:hypothetical protein
MTRGLEEHSRAHDGRVHPHHVLQTPQHNTTQHLKSRHFSTLAAQETLRKTRVTTVSLLTFPRYKTALCYTALPTHTTPHHTTPHHTTHYTLHTTPLHSTVLHRNMRHTPSYPTLHCTAPQHTHTSLRHYPPHHTPSLPHTPVCRAPCAPTTAA